MAKTVYMIANRDAVGVFTDPDFRWTKDCIGSVIVDRDLSDARREVFDGDTLYRCEPISADEEPAPEPRTVKAYVAFDPSDSDGQDIWAFSTIEAAMDRRGCPIFEIEMREVPPPAPKRETGWAIMGGPSGPLYGRGGYGRLSRSPSARRGPLTSWPRCLDMAPPPSRSTATHWIRSMIDIIFDGALSLVTAYFLITLGKIVVDWLAATAAQNELDREEER